MKMLVDGHVPFLPEEILTNILKRLPVKSLIRFQCVCKHWKNLIKTPSFIQDHLHHHSTHLNPPLLIEHVVHWDDPLNLCMFDCETQFHEFENAPSMVSLEGVVVVGSCHGLICLADCNIQPPAPLLWNPATREVRQMPITFNDFPFGWHFGFGFNPIINDYKIVRFSETDMICEVEVYSLNTGSWRNINFDSIKDVSISGDGVTVNGVMFWYGSIQGLDIMGTDDTDVIISFDLATEVFTVTPLPVLLSHSRVKLAVYEDKLAIISHPWVINSQFSYIYFGVMEKGGIGSSAERWNLSRKYIRNFANSATFKLNAETIWRNQIVCIGYGKAGLIGEAECEMKNAEPKVGLYLIDVTTNERKQFTIPRHGHGFRVGVYNYVQSLVPIGSIQR